MILGERVLKRAAGGIGFAIFGSGAVFALMLLMNGVGDGVDEQTYDEQASFEVESPPEPPDPPEKRPNPESRPEESTTDPAPPPEIGSSIGSIGFDMPSFSPGSVDQASRELVGDVQASVMTSDSVDKRPQPIRKVDPKLPRRVVEKQVEGRVVVEALVDEEGRVVEVRIKRAEPEGLFEPHVREAVEQWQFEPARYEGEAVKTWIELPFDFELG